MLKNKMIMLVLSISLVLTGCSTVVHQKTSDVKTESKNQTSQQTTNSSSASINTGTNQSSGTTTDTSGGANKSPGTTANPSGILPIQPVKNTTALQNNVNRSLVTAVRLADFNTGWVGGNGWIAKTTSGGKKWAVVYQGSGTVKQLFALNHSDVWATLNQGGTNLRLLKSSDGGKHWAFIGIVPTNSFLHFTSKTTALSGKYLSQDGGKRWISLPTPKRMVGDAYFHDVKNGWAVTQSNNVFYVKRAINGGKSWSTVMTKSLFSPLAGAMIRSAGTNDAWIELIGGTGMNQTAYSVFHTIDGGKSWKTVIANSTAGGGPAPGFGLEYNNGPNNMGAKPGPLYVVNPQIAFMGGSCPACDIPNSIGWTKDAGKTWINSNVTLKGYGEAYLAIADEKHGWWITTENEKPSTMYTTSDGGLHWNQIHIFR
ncbi:hypothetical protein [Neobacillus sp. PS3-40]|uniref:WD40/YVTN/BNR-like repeat-containing protein n=1 Tax=Neobacillus sp. PS3-40 TaxID=3070679 RepID=UPI0027DF42BD|nr:hypothetical protein [Neobacillus sp. PS3-40]WML43913.1 hypothetical protein RCG20_19360 [Neobacillus sp. PS3-40]